MSSPTKSLVKANPSPVHSKRRIASYGASTGVGGSNMGCEVARGHWAERRD